LINSWRENCHNRQFEGGTSVAPASWTAAPLCRFDHGIYFFNAVWFLRIYPTTSEKCIAFCHLLPPFVTFCHLFEIFFISATCPARPARAPRVGVCGSIMVRFGSDAFSSFRTPQSTLRTWKNHGSFG
jgi:hypothetical protein